jgi:hypothetical protein
METGPEIENFIAGIAKNDARWRCGKIIGPRASLGSYTGGII